MKSSQWIWHYVVSVKSTVKILSFFLVFPRKHELYLNQKWSGQFIATSSDFFKVNLGLKSNYVHMYLIILELWKECEENQQLQRWRFISENLSVFLIYEFIWYFSSNHAEEKREWNHHQHFDSISSSDFWVLIRSRPLRWSPWWKWRKFELYPAQEDSIFLRGGVTWNLSSTYDTKILP